jgi:hypothetical protein
MKSQHGKMSSLPLLHISAMLRSIVFPLEPKPKY